MDSTATPDKPLAHAVATVAVTARLSLRRLDNGDASFVLTQLNQAGWLRFIGDRGVRSLDAAREYLQARIVGEYRRLGFGMYGIELRSTGQLIGMCGLVKRDYLDAPDLGFALLDDQAGRGYAREAAAAVMHHAHAELRLPRVLGICKADNLRSIALLEGLGFGCAGSFELPPAMEVLQLFIHDRSPAHV